MKLKLLLTISLVLVMSACATTNQRVLDSGDETQLQKRSYQTRTFDTGDKEKVMRAVISTLQDLGFVIDRADLLLGSVSGTKLNVNQTRINVSVRPKGEQQMVVRANAQFNITPIEDPKQYQDFFASLEKSLFLASNSVE